MSKPEFHYVVSYIPGEGWRTAFEMADMFSDGTVYETETGEWHPVTEDEAALDEKLYGELKARLTAINWDTLIPQMNDLAILIDQRFAHYEEHDALNESLIGILDVLVALRDAREAKA